MRRQSMEERTKTKKKDKEGETAQGERLRMQGWKGYKICWM